MATKIVTKNSSTASAVPTASDLVQGELAVNVADKRLFTEDNTGTIVELGTNPSTIDINAGSIDGTAIGASSASTGAFTTLTATGLTVDTNTLYVDSTNNRVGIGTTSPAESIHTTGNIRLGDSAPAELYSNSSELRFGVDKNNDNGTSNITFYVDDNEKMRIDSSGNVGIGTSSTTFKLDVAGNARANYFALRGNESAPSESAFVYRPATGVLGFGTSTAERMRIDSSGNVGIGTSSPSTELHVDGSITYDGRLRPHSTASDGSAAVPAIVVGYDYDTGLYRPASNTIGFSTGGSERMRIDSSGNLLVGTTSVNPQSRASGEGVQISPDFIGVGRYQNAALYLNRQNNDGDIAVFRKDGSTVGSIGTSFNSGSRYFYISGLSATGVGFYSNGIYPSNGTGGFADNSKDLGSSTVRWDDVYATNGTIQTSDRNEKQDIAELSEAEQRVAVAAKGLLRKFRWKDSVAEKGDDARIHFGIIAQDLQAAFEAEGLDAGDYAMFISTTWTDEETNEEKTRMGVRYSELLAFIISAI